MENIYLLMIIALVVLAIADLVVGVSNDAVNFLNSAIGSKAISFRTIMIVASIGIAVGAVFSSGMMEVARKGIFNPGEFMFNEIMIIFMAVMITDILLLDFFNTLGMPTSTTVSIVFELLGASLAMAVIKVYGSGGEFADVAGYINTSKATQIILGILLSVAVAFTIGALVQYITRMLLSFEFRKNPKWVGAVFGGLALTAITYFILIKGLKGTSFIDQGAMAMVHDNTVAVLLVGMLFWSLISYLVINVLKFDIYRLIIIVGTFALALAFAGNDLVNFIGVPIAAWQSFEAWKASGLPATEFSMGVLAQKVPTPTLFLFFSGLVMVVTLWFSKKARYVTQTEINLSREGESKERFQPNFLSRSIVRGAIGLSAMFNGLLSEETRAKIDGRFRKPVIALPKDKSFELPAFDMVRAAVNLSVAGILISIATSYKLPLSTTYVTFMVAMGTSLADRAWGAESAVYRVAGVLNVIGGWFFTAICALVAAATMAYLINLGGGTALAILLFIAVLLLMRNYISHKKKSEVFKVEDRLRKAESSSTQGVINESAQNISKVVGRSNKIYTNIIDGLARQDLDMLKKNKKQVGKLSDEIEELRDNIFYFIKNLDEPSVGASNFYINMVAHLQDMAQSLELINKVSHKHVNNNHKKLKYNQIKELKEIDHRLEAVFKETIQAYEEQNFEQIGFILNSKQELFDLVSQKIAKQVERTRKDEQSPKNTSLYFSILLETKDLLKSTMELMEQYYHAHDSTVRPPIS